MLRVTVADAAQFSGNAAAFERYVTIDTTPPTIELVTDDRYVNFGGFGAIVCKASADAASNGVKIGEYFFPGVPGQVKDRPDHRLAFFVHPCPKGAMRPPEAGCPARTRIRTGDERCRPRCHGERG